MKIYTFTDVHARPKVIQKIIINIKKYKPDLLIDCGDLSWFGKSLNIFVKKLNQLNIPLLILHGNHETINDMKKLENKYKNVIYIHKRSYSINNYVFFGYGGGGFQTTDRAIEKIIPRLKKTLKKDDKLIFITHMPIYNTKQDFLNDQHVGNKSARKLIEKLKPILVLSGHIHENEKIKDKINNTLLINPGIGLLLKI